MQMTEILFYGSIIGRTVEVSGIFETVYSIHDPFCLMGVDIAQEWLWWFMRLFMKEEEEDQSQKKIFNIYNKKSWWWGKGVEQQGPARWTSGARETWCATKGHSLL